MGRGIRGRKGSKSEKGAKRERLKERPAANGENMGKKKCDRSASTCGSAAGARTAARQKVNKLQTQIKRENNVRFYTSGAGHRTNDESSTSPGAAAASARRQAVGRQTVAWSTCT